MQSLADINREIQTGEARLAALRLARVKALMPADWPETVMEELRGAFQEAEFDAYGDAKRFKLGENVLVMLRVEIFDPDAPSDDEEEAVE